MTLELKNNENIKSKLALTKKEIRSLKLANILLASKS